MTQLDPSSAGGAPRLRILLIEDDSAASKGLSKLLEAHGYAVAVVNDGASALAALRAGPPPDFVLTDLQLPDLDGREIARFSRALKPTPKVALITGWDLDLSVDQRRENGIDGILPKPLHLQDLVAWLNQAIGKSTPDEEGNEKG